MNSCRINNKSSRLKKIAIIVFGFILILYNQRLSIDYLKKEKLLPLTATDYTLSEVGTEKGNIQKYRLEKGSGCLLIGFSDPNDFSSLLQFKGQVPQKVKFKFAFHPTKGCNSNSFPKKMEVVVEHNGVSTVLPIDKTALSELNVRVSNGEPIKIHAQAEPQAGVCGSVCMIMTGVETTSWLQIIGLWFFWIMAVCIMLINGNYFLPIFSLILFKMLQKAELLYTPVLSWEQQLFFSALSIGLVFAFSLINSLNFRKIWGRVLSVIGLALLLIIVCFIPITVLGFNTIFEGVMNKYDWFAILQTDFGEVREFISVFAPKKIIMQALLAVFLFVLATFFSRKSRSCNRFSQYFMVALSVVITPFYVSSSNVLERSSVAILEYYHDLSLLEKQIAKRKDIVNEINANKDSSDEVYVVIVGESANRNHFSLYGYPRLTTPRLDARLKNKELIRFEQSYSCGVSTRGALQYALTQATLEKGSPWKSSTIMEVLNATSFETYWIHNGSTSIRHNLVNLIGEQAEFTDNLSSVYGLEDGKLLVEVDNILSAKSISNKIIFLKTQGSHVDYCKRLPEGDEWLFEDKEFDRWLIPKKYKITQISAASNCYDGSIKYTDYFIDEVITRIQNSGKVGAVIYFSDHGEEIVEGAGHMGKKPTYGVFAIPMTIWFSDSYKKKYETKYNNTVINAKKIFINDSIFDSVLGISGVEFNGIDRKNDVSSEMFQSGHYIYRGKKTVYDADNYLFYTYKNLQKLKYENERKNFDVFLGPITHPFHLAWLTGEYQYPHLAISGIYNNGEYLLSLSHGARKPVSLGTVFKYLNPQPAQKFFIRVDFFQGAEVDSDRAADEFISFLDKHHLNSAQLLVASTSRPYLDALSKRGIVVSYLFDGSDSVKNQPLYRTVTISVDKSTPIAGYHSTRPVNLLFSSCSVDTCLDQIFTTTKELSKKMRIERVVIPMFTL